MGVYTSFIVGVGFVIEQDAIKRYRKTVANEDDYAEEELLELLLHGNDDGLTFGTGGSYYTDREPLTHWVAIDRLTNSYDTRDIPGGVIGLTKATITLAEREALNRVAASLGQSEVTIGQFMSVLWH